MNVLDFSIDPNNRYTFWSGITGGLFLALSYFGTDQSQVQRYLSGKSLAESQRGLIMNGFLKIPMQFFILLIGVLVFVFFQFEKAPLHFNPYAVEKVKSTPEASLKPLKSPTTSFTKKNKNNSKKKIFSLIQATKPNISNWKNRPKGTGPRPKKSSKPTNLKLNPTTRTMSSFILF